MDMIERVGIALVVASRRIESDVRLYELTDDEVRMLARAAIEAMKYDDGTDEETAMTAGWAIGVDAVLAIDCHNAWIDAALNESPQP